MTPADETRLAALRTAMSGRTRYEGQDERTDEFLMRLLDDASDQLWRAAAANARLETKMIEWRACAQRWTPGGSEYMAPAVVERFIADRRIEHTQTKLEKVRLEKELARLKAEIDGAAAQNGPR